VSTARRRRGWRRKAGALATSVVWGAILAPLMTRPEQFPYLIELVRWVGPLVNLGAAKWWLDHTAARTAIVIPFPTGTATTRSRAA
jgi:hypothetical protein